MQRPLLAAAVLAALACAAPAAAADAVFVPVADALVRSDNPTSKYGTSTVVRARSTSPEIRSYLRFVVSGFGPAAGATLRLYVTDPSSSGGSIGVVADSTWVESTITYATSPPIGPPVATSGAAVGGTWVEFDVGAVVTGDGTYDLGLTSAVTDSVYYSSREGANPPQLVVRSGGPSPPNAQFGTNPTSGTAPLNVDFTDLSSGGPTAWLWEFGDGTTSPEQSPSHTYETPGTYTVSLTVSNFIGSDTETKAGLITVREPGGAGTVTVLAAGDIACDPASSSFKAGLGTATRCRQKYTADLIAATAPDAVLTLGDLQYESATLANFLASYDLSWGLHRAVTYPAPGNHEYLVAGAAGYFDYWGARAGDRARGYYSFDVGAWHVVVLNSNCSAVGGCGAGSPQEQWLRADLAANASRCTLAAWHHPRWSAGGASSTYAGFWKALYELDADLVVSGHRHNYQRWAPQSPSGVRDTLRGIRQFVVGTGGHSLGSVVEPGKYANLEAYQTSVYGVLELRLNEFGYEWRFLPEAGKTYDDAGSGACH